MKTFRSLKAFWNLGKPYLDERDDSNEALWRLTIGSGDRFCVLYYPPHEVLRDVDSLPKNWIAV